MDADFDYNTVHYYLVEVIKTCPPRQCPDDTPSVCRFCGAKQDSIVCNVCLNKRIHKNFMRTFSSKCNFEKKVFKLVKYVFGIHEPSIAKLLQEQLLQHNNRNELSIKHFRSILEQQKEARKEEEKQTRITKRKPTDSNTIINVNNNNVNNNNVNNNTISLERWLEDRETRVAIESSLGELLLDENQKRLIVEQSLKQLKLDEAVMHKAVKESLKQLSLDTEQDEIVTFYKKLESIPKVEEFEDELIDEFDDYENVEDELIDSSDSESDAKQEIINK